MTDHGTTANQAPAAPHNVDDGTRFGAVVVTVSRAMGDCVLHIDAAVSRRPFAPRFNSMEEIEGAIAAQQSRATADSVAGDMVRALRFAHDMLSRGRS